MKWKVKLETDGDSSTAIGEHPVKCSKHEGTSSNVEPTAVVNSAVSGNSSSAHLNDLYEVAPPLSLDSDSNASKVTILDHLTLPPQAHMASLFPSVDSDLSDMELSLLLLSLTTRAMTTRPVTHEHTTLARPTTVVKNPL